MFQKVFPPVQIDKWRYISIEIDTHEISTLALGQGKEIPARTIFLNIAIHFLIIRFIELKTPETKLIGY